MAFEFTHQECHTITKTAAGTESWWHLTINYSSLDPDHWTISFVDYDGAIGAMGIFSSEQEVMENIEKFVELAKYAYEKKIAKYSGCPEIRKDEHGNVRLFLEDEQEAYLWRHR